MSIFDALAKWNRTREKTNAEGILGKEAIVTAAIDNLKGTGQISLEGMDWTARTRDGQNVSKGSVVRILAIEGVKVIVEKVEKEEE
ncbi:MAG: NfeD family protein [Lachnospiraceae bacterium]|nr:NfeD family protein [Lachnospiraceae bacterium]